MSAPKKSLARAQRECERYNKLADEVERAMERVEELKRRHRAAYGAMFDALPEGYAISLDPGGPSEVVAR